MQFPSLPFIISNGIADTGKIGLDSYKIWDKIMAWWTESNYAPASTPGKIAATTLMSLAGSIVDFNLGGDSILAKIVTDAPSALGSRLLQDHPNKTLSTKEIGALFTMEAGARSELLHWYRTTDTQTRERFKIEWQKWIATELAIFVGMNEQDKQTLLDLKAKPAPGPSSVGTFIDRLANLINPFADRS
jgi:hypothetical protein